MKIEVEKGYRCIYTWINSNYKYSKTSQEVELIPEKIVKYYKNKIDKWEGADIASIQPHEKIYFTKDAQFPRHKLKEMMPNHVTRKIENADYIVINKQSLNITIDKAYVHNWYWDGNDWLEQNTPETSGNKVEKFANSIYFPDIVHRFQVLEGLQTKKVIIDEELCRLIPREVEIKGDLYEKLRKMLTCNDKNSIKIGVEILSNLNYKEFEVETVILLNQSISNIRAYQLQNGVLFKSLLVNVEKDYPDYATSDYLSFILRLIDKAPDNPNVLKLVNDYFNRKHPTAKGTYQITIIEDQIGEKLRNNELVI